MQCRIWLKKKPNMTSDGFWAPVSHIDAIIINCFETHPSLHIWLGPNSFFFELAVWVLKGFSELAVGVKFHCVCVLIARRRWSMSCECPEPRSARRYSTFHLPPQPRSTSQVIISIQCLTIHVLSYRIVFNQLDHWLVPIDLSLSRTIHL